MVEAYLRANNLFVDYNEVNIFSETAFYFLSLKYIIQAIFVFVLMQLLINIP